MLRLFAFLFVAAFFAMSTCTQKVDVNMERAKANAVTAQQCHPLQTGDMALYSETITLDSNMVVSGPHTAERLVGWEALKDAVKKLLLTFFEKLKVSVKSYLSTLIL